MTFLRRRPFRLRPACAPDAPALAAIMWDWAETTPWLPRVHSRAETGAHAARLVAEMEVVVATAPARRPWARGGAAAGHLPPAAPAGAPAGPLGFIARREGFVHALYVARGARGRGIGSALLATAKHAAPRLTLWVFAANTPARAFYAREGFRFVEPGCGNDEGLPEFRLEWHAPHGRPPR